jgi:hypothetical protein
LRSIQFLGNDILVSDNSEGLKLFSYKNKKFEIKAADSENRKISTSIIHKDKIYSLDYDGNLLVHKIIENQEKNQNLFKFEFSQENIINLGHIARKIHVFKDEIYI